MFTEFMLGALGILALSWFGGWLIYKFYGRDKF